MATVIHLRTLWREIDDSRSIATKFSTSDIVYVLQLQCISTVYHSNIFSLYISIYCGEVSFNLHHTTPCRPTFSSCNTHYSTCAHYGANFDAPRSIAVNSLSLTFSTHSISSSFLTSIVQTSFFVHLYSSSDSPTRSSCVCIYSCRPTLSCSFSFTDLSLEFFYVCLTHTTEPEGYSSLLYTINDFGCSGTCDCRSVRVRIVLFFCCNGTFI